MQPALPRLTGPAWTPPPGGAQAHRDTLENHPYQGAQVAHRDSLGAQGAQGRTGGAQGRTGRTGAHRDSLN
jgi:hypothetical protein